MKDKLILLLIPNNIKNSIIKKVRISNPLLNIKFMNINELYHNYYFTYNKKTIHYLMTTYGYKYEVAKIYLDNLYYIDNKKYNNDKLDYLVKIKDELNSHKLLTHNPLFKESLQDRHLVIYGYPFLKKEDKALFSKIDAQYEVINKKDSITYKHTIYEFNTIIEEVEYLANDIIDLVTNNPKITLNNIKIMGIDKEYYNIINRIFTMYHIAINGLPKVSLYSVTMGKYFLDNLHEDITETIDLIKNNFDLNYSYNQDIYNQLINIINDYTFINNYLDIKDMLSYDLKHTYIDNILYDQMVEITDIHSCDINDSDYVYLLNFNSKNLPKVYKDEDYLSDKLKEQLGFSVTKDNNNEERTYLLNLIPRIKNLKISYKLSSGQGSHTISNLNDDLNYEIISKQVPYNHSRLSNQLRLSYMIDDLIKYGTYNEDLDKLYHTYHTIPYNSYDNKFTGIDKDKLKEYLDNKLLLSYSSIDNYYRCGFRYYISNILRLEDKADTFTTFIGSLFHEILSKAFVEGFNFEESYQEFIQHNNKKLDIKENFFLKKLKEELKTIINIITEQYNYTNLDKAIYEEKIYTNIDNNNLEVTFMGIIDKLMYKEENGQTIVGIIDYKTGTPQLNLNQVIYGIGMQLPIYIYLSKRTDKLSDVVIGGFYLQPILHNEIVKDYKHSYSELKKQKLRLQGYSNSDESILEEVDKNYKSSQIIKSMKVSSKGFYKYAKILDNEAIDQLDTMVGDNINKASHDISEGKFSINPKRIGMDNVGCKYCKFNDICYMTESDIVNLKEYKNLEFLKEGEEDAQMDK